MKYIDITTANSFDGVKIIAIDESEMKTNFDTETTKITAMYCDGTKDNLIKLSELRLNMSYEYISDMYGLRGEISDEDKARAALDTAQKILEDNKRIPAQYEGAICKSGHSIIFIPKIDMQATQP